jgi:hypothetical protein
MKILLKIVLPVFLPSVLFADQFVFVSHEEACKAKKLIEKSRQLIIFCDCCDSKDFTYLHVDSVQARGEGDTYKLIVFGKSKGNEKIQITADLAYCFVKVKTKAVSVSDCLNMKIDLIQNTCAKPFAWNFPLDNADYWISVKSKSRDLSKSFVILDQSLDIELDSTAQVKFKNEKAEQFLGEHFVDHFITVNPTTLETFVSFTTQEQTTCNTIIKMSKSDLVNDFVNLYDTILNMYLQIDGSLYHLAEASVSITGKDGDVHETSTLSPIFYYRLVEYLREIPVRTAEQSRSLFPEYYLQGIMKIDVARFKPVSNSSAGIPLITMRDVCVVAE